MEGDDVFEESYFTPPFVEVVADSILQDDHDRKLVFLEKFETSVKAFERRCSVMTHLHCHICNIVSLQDIFKKPGLCKSCAASSSWTDNYPGMLPLWMDKQNVLQFCLPKELLCLREGEKLLIQQISVYVPLHHLMYGQLGAKGHIVSFPQDISEVCTRLPKLPSAISLIRVVKHFKLQDGEISSKSFSVRKRVVLEALVWLKKFNILYADIEIVEENMDWIENGEEQQLPPSILQVQQNMSVLEHNGEDRGPAEDQIANINDAASDHEPCYGTVSQYNNHVPKVKDIPVVECITNALESNRKENGTSNHISMDFPYVSPHPVCEYSEPYLFEKAFPWLFPGGTGGYSSTLGSKPSLAEWMQKTLLYKDGRFSKDKMWAFCALNFLTRHMNQSSGGFFVDTFFKNGPKTLEELQEQISQGHKSWLNSISYYSFRVTGSSAYWRSRRTEVFAWINHHLERNHGPPSFFITLSCAEYHWKDIERLIIDRCEKAGVPIPEFEKKGRVALINEHSLVVQEYFQNRVEAWIDTVGKDLLGIQHHWLRYEFAPSRGQIHVHMLAICSNMDMLRKCHELHMDRPKLASYLSSWMEDTLRMSATVDENCVEEIKASDTTVHPSMVNFADISEADALLDTTNCQLKFQNHKCSAYCMRKRSLPNSKEDEDARKRRVCRCGAGVEATFMKCDTPGFQLRTSATILRDLRGFDRVDLCRNNRSITQSSTFLMRGWRGNCDIQVLIYKSAPEDIDANDVSRVTNYVVSYACKGTESVVEQKKSMASIILAAKEEMGDDKDVKKLARRLLNECTKNRVVSKQEALCQLAGLSLFSCSEGFENVSLSGNARLQTEFAGKKTFLARYANRDASESDLSLDQFFHKSYNEKRCKGKKIKIPIYSGAQCEAIFPATNAYARAVMLIYCPWIGKFPLGEEEPDLIDKFKAFVVDKNKCPTSVSVSYERARQLNSMKEPVSSAGDLDYENFAVRPDQEHTDLVDLATTMYNTIDNDRDSSEMNYFYGEEMNWSDREIDVSQICTVLQVSFSVVVVLTPNIQSLWGPMIILPVFSLPI